MSVSSGASLIPQSLPAAQNAIVIASQQYTKPGGKGRADVFANAMKQDFKSKNPTTRWSDIIKLK